MFYHKNWANGPVEYSVLGFLVNKEFTLTGVCQFQIRKGDHTQWAFDAFSNSYFSKGQCKGYTMLF